MDRYRKPSHSTGEIPTPATRKEWEAGDPNTNYDVHRVNFFRLSLELKRKKIEMDKAAGRDIPQHELEVTDGSIEKELTAALPEEPLILKEQQNSPNSSNRSSIELFKGSNSPEHSVRFEQLHLNLDPIHDSNESDGSVSPSISKKSPQKGILKSPGTSRLTLSPTSSKSPTPRSVSPINFPGESDIQELDQELEQDHDNEIVEISNGKIVVMAGSAQQLVNRLAGAKTIDIDYTRDFILTYRHFITSEELLDMLMIRFQFETPPDAIPDEIEYWNRWRTPVRLRVINVLRKWVEKNFSDFRQDTHLLQKFTAFVEDVVSKSELSRWATALTELLRDGSRILSTPTNSFFDQQTVPKPILPKDLSKIESFLDIPHTELARQLTLYEWKLFSKVTPNQMRIGLWTKGNKAQLSPDMDALSTWFNKLSFRIATEILQADLKVRTKILSCWIKVAEECRKMNNFNTLMEILAALGMTCVSRLKKTWKELSEKSRDLYQALEELMSGFGNYKNYRQELETQTRPILPYFGVCLRDLLFIEEGNPDRLENCMINFNKLRMVANVITSVQYFQEKTFIFEVVPEIQAFIAMDKEGLVLDEEVLYEKSVQYEPVNKALPITSPRRRTTSLGANFLRRKSIRPEDTPSEDTGSNRKISIDFSDELAKKLANRPSVEELEQRNIYKSKGNRASWVNIGELLSRTLKSRHPSNGSDHLPLPTAVLPSLQQVNVQQGST